MGLREKATAIEVINSIFSVFMAAAATEMKGSDWPSKV